jgi:hypothetical protein
MLHEVLGGYGLDFLIDIGLSLLAGFLIDAERESRGKPAGISTHCFVIGGTMMFTLRHWYRLQEGLFLQSLLQLVLPPVHFQQLFCHNLVVPLVLQYRYYLCAS